MPLKGNIKSVLVLTSGPIVVGQACEFDYSGTQACCALKEEGLDVRLIGSNPASIVTDPRISNRTYMEPLDIDTLQIVIEKDKPDAILPTMGGQVALNAFMELKRRGALEKVQVLGVTSDAIEKAENRKLFQECMQKIELETPKNAIALSLEEAEEILKSIPLPVIIRPSFTLGGAGGGIAYNLEEFRRIVSMGLEISPISQILVEESIAGWKEFEMEVVRDSSNNCIVICSIENLDPMGVHTGDSITVAPALTLSDKEYQVMRDASFAVMREIGVTSGGSNVQFAINPENGRMCVIEMNPRVSRSSALASKATGFPVARVAALLAVGYTIDEIQNSVLKNMPASFEPTLDYVVTKIPKFAFEKFPNISNKLGTSMKSVGEVMAIGGSFLESLQKAYISLEEGMNGLDAKPCKAHLPEEIFSELATPTPDRLQKVAWAIQKGMNLEMLYQATKIDRWFLREIQRFLDFCKEIEKDGISESNLRQAKVFGFSDIKLAEIWNMKVEEVRAARGKHQVFPVSRRVDGSGGEFDTSANYMYLTYSLDSNASCESNASNRKKVIVVGSGPNRIGQGVEFDYCCVQAIWAFAKEGFETIMINCNPETVSTDYDAPSIGGVKNFSHRLYFEPVNSETLIEVMRIEGQPLEGIVVQMGGQTPLKILMEQDDLPVLGTSKDSIDLSENREKFSALLKELDIRQPNGGIATNLDQARKVVAGIGFPILIRPSHVIGGRSMEVIWNMSDLERSESFKLYSGIPILMDQYLQDGIEVDLDCLCDGDEVFIVGIMEHIEEAGIHSGDSSCVIPPVNLSQEIIDRMMAWASQIGLAMKVQGWLNIQFAICNGDLYVLEANSRASRTVPFLSKFTNMNLNEYACQIMLGKKIKNIVRKSAAPRDYVAVKASAFPFRPFSADPVLGPEMLSTGEVMGIAKSFPAAFYKAQMGIGIALPTCGTVFFSLKDEDKSAKTLAFAKKLENLGFNILATGGTHKFLRANGVKSERVNKVLQGRPHIIDLMKDGKVDLTINTTKGKRSLADSYAIRETSLRRNIPCYTSISAAEAVVKAIQALNENKTEHSVTILQEMG